MFQEEYARSRFLDLDRDPISQKNPTKTQYPTLNPTFLDSPNILDYVFKIFFIIYNTKHKLTIMLANSSSQTF